MTSNKTETYQPRFELHHVVEDGRQSELEVFDLADVPPPARIGRRRFVGVALSVAAALMFLEGCASGRKNRNIKYKKYDNVSKTWKTYTLPCGSAIPPGATCTCNCVAAPAYTQPYRTRTYRSCSCVPVCTCNKVCTCIPVCQAHFVLDDDYIVRRMAEELLFVMGSRQLPYLKWAASTAEPGVRARIRGIIAEISSGTGPDPSRWPSEEECIQYLNHDEPVVRIISAQLLSLRPVYRLATSATDMLPKQVGHALRLAREMAWYLRAS